MKFEKIKSIIVGTGASACKYCVGVDEITEILDKSREYPDSVDFIFYVMKGDFIAYEIINQPVILSR